LQVVDASVRVADVIRRHPQGSEIDAETRVGKDRIAKHCITDTRLAVDQDPNTVEGNRIAGAEWAPN
jgi:hypothetical protein